MAPPAIGSIVSGVGGRFDIRLRLTSTPMTAAAQPWRRGAGDDPGGKVGRCEATSGGGDVRAREERLVEHSDASVLDPWLGGEVGAGGHLGQQAEFRQDQRAGTLGGPQLAAGVEREALHEFGAFDDLACVDATADDDGVGGAGFFEQGLRAHGDAVHRADLRLGAAQGHSPAGAFHAVEHAERDQ
jgi:hypothetical protein